MTEPEIRVVDDPEASRFELWVGDTLAGFAQYRRAPAATSFVHTLIEDEFGGQGLGSVLARGALDATRAAGEAVLPYCPFIRRFVERHPDYLDLVPADRRAEFELPAAG